MNPRGFREVVILCITSLLLLIPIAGATYDIVSNLSSNSTEYTTSSSYGELHNISLATGNGTTFLTASWDARMNFTAPLYARFLRDGVSFGRFNLTQNVYATVGSYQISFAETTGTHYYSWEVYSNRKGTIYSRNFSAFFLVNGSYGTGAGGGNVSSVTGAPAGVLDCTGIDDITCTISPQGTNFRNDTISIHTSQITTLQNNDTVDRSYVNATFLPIATYSGDFPNSTVPDKLDISTYSGNFPNTTIANLNGNYPNSSLINYLLITTYTGNFPNTTIANLGGDYPNSSLVNYLLIATYGTNFPNSTVAGNLANWNATYNATYDAKVGWTQALFDTAFHTEIPICNATTGKLVSDDGEVVTCGTDQTGAAGGNVSSVTAQSPLTYTGTTDVIIKDERTTYPNDTVSGNILNWNATYNATYDAKPTLAVVNTSALLAGTSQVTGLDTALSEKEPTISGSTDNVFWNGLKAWIALGISNVTGLQTALDAKLATAAYGTNFPNDTVSGNLVTWNATYNSSYNSLLENAPNATVAGNLANWNATYNASYAYGGFDVPFSNGSSVLAAGTKTHVKAKYAGTLTDLTAHSVETGSINITAYNLTLGTYIGSVVITASTDGSTSGLSYAFAKGDWLNLTISSVTSIKQVTAAVQTTKS